MVPPVARRVPYKDFLQPALQRRFAGTAAIVLGLAYVESLTLSRLSLFTWSYSPLGLPALRAVIIFLSILPIIVLRIAHAHMGFRTSHALSETLANTGLLFSAFETVLTYATSAFFFSQVYLLSTPEEAGIRWISRTTGRSRLNEQAVFYTVGLVILGLVQGVLHIALDLDRMVLGTVQKIPENDDSNEGHTPSPKRPQHWTTQIRERAPILLVRCGMLAIAVSFANYVVIYHFLRASAWRSSMWFFRILYSDLPRYNLPLGGAPWSVWMLGRTIWASFLLSLLWYFGDVAFRVLLAREPLKVDQPLTAESKDPNGSLVNGLQSKKPRISAFAMWELAFIARDFKTRRQSIFEDIDRKDGPMWSQIYAVCLDTIRTIERRIDEYGRPATSPPPTQSADSTQPRERISRPLKNNDVSASRPADKTYLIRDTVSKVLTSPGKTPIQAWMPGIKKGAGLVADQVMTTEQQAALQPRAVRGYLTGLSMVALGLPVVGPMFQQTFGRQLAKAALGTPYAETSMYINAVYAVSRLAVCSLTEDKYGNVQRDVAVIIRTLTAVIRKLEAFRDKFPTHWTDLSQDRQCPEVTAVLMGLKDGLGELVTAFGLYSGDLRLSRADMRLAREAADKGKAEKAT
ncbi:nucleoporin protein Ndc1-Nup [Xylaria palmicola]|nr:nucleoporin protein Ndc1-Nup [Xylaria palmicola]